MTKFEQIGARLKEVMDVKNINQQKMATLANISRSMISAICAGKTKPSPEVLEVLFSLWDVNPKWFYNGLGEMFLADNNIRQSYPGLPDDDNLEDFIKCLQVPIIYYSIISDFIILKKQYATFINEYFEPKEEVIHGNNAG